MTQLEAQGPARACDESKEEERVSGGVCALRFGSWVFGWGAEFGVRGLRFAVWGSGIALCGLGVGCGFEVCILRFRSWV